MADRHADPDGLDATRAALAPTLDATAAILPWLATPAAPRFDPKLNTRWMEACAQLDAAWHQRHEAGETAIRPQVFQLYGIALETADADCLRLGEALASAIDRIEASGPGLRLVAAVTATAEALSEGPGLEHECFSERARHFAQRLEQAAAEAPDQPARSTVLDRLFVSENSERLELMRDALAALPADIVALRHDAAQMALEAEQIGLYGIMHFSRQLLAALGDGSALANDAAYATVAGMLDQLAAMLLAVDA